AAAPLRIRHVELRLLRQDRAGRATLDALENLDSLLVAARGHLVARVCVQFFWAVLVVEARRAAARDQGERRQAEGQSGCGQRKLHRASGRIAAAARRGE